MTQVQFYQLLSTPFERAVPKLLEKAHAAGLRVQLVLENDARAQFMNEQLWIYDANSFLPHGAEGEANAEAQPVLLSTSLTPINAPHVLFITDGRSIENMEGLERVIDMFDGRDESSLTAARVRFSAYKNAGHTMAYFQQTSAGGWEKKA